MNIQTDHMEGLRNQIHWFAWDADTYDGPGSVMGYGDTEQEAIDDLREQLEAAAPDSDPAMKNAGDVALEALTELANVFLCRTCTKQIVPDEDQQCPECAVEAAEARQDAATGR